MISVFHRILQEKENFPEMFSKNEKLNQVSGKIWSLTFTLKPFLFTLLHMHLSALVRRLMIVIGFIFSQCRPLFNPFPNKPRFLCVCSPSNLKRLWEKEKLLVTSNFSFSLSVFHLSGEFFAIFIKFEIVFCKLLQFQRIKNLKIVIWEWVKDGYLGEELLVLKKYGL